MAYKRHLLGIARFKTALASHISDITQLPIHTTAGEDPHTQAGIDENVALNIADSHAYRKKTEVRSLHPKLKFITYTPTTTITLNPDTSKEPHRAHTASGELATDDEL